MARQVVWSYEAFTDLEELAEYIARDSEFYAAGFVQEILQAANSLSTFFQRGRIVPEFHDPSIREIFVREMRLIYAIEQSRIAVLGLIHGRRDLKKLWEGR